MSRFRCRTCEVNADTREIHSYLIRASRAAYSYRLEQSMLHKPLNDIPCHGSLVPASVRTQLECVCTVSSNGTPCHSSSLLTLSAQNLSTSVEKVGPMSATAVALHERMAGLTFLRQAYHRSSLHMAGMTSGGAEISRLHDRGRLESPVFREIPQCDPSKSRLLWPV